MKQQLSEAEQDLADTKRDHANDMQSQGYDKLSEDLKTSLDDTEYEISHNADKQLEIINSMLDKAVSSYQEAYGKINSIIKNTGWVGSTDFNNTQSDLSTETGVKNQNSNASQSQSSANKNPSSTASGTKTDPINSNSKANSDLADQMVKPVNFLPGNTVGINISPLILKMAFNAQLIMDNLRMVIKDILDNTDSAVALIPHVAWEDNNDWLPLSVLYKTFKNSNRVCLIEDQSAQKLKWIISKCSCFIGARTHATIAAYSTGVPTLALGYSVKSKGIAQDIFGTAENYVVPYQDIVTKDTILSHYKWIKKHSYEIREVLLNKTNEYQKIILETGKILKDRYYNS